MKLSRRELAAVLALPAAAPAQTPPTGSPGELETARETLRRHAAEMAGVKLPPDTEPAFQFKA